MSHVMTDSSNRFRNFAARLLEHEGALVESLDPQGLEAMLPENLQQAIGAPEFLRLGFAAELPAGAEHASLESDWLEKFGRLLDERGRRLKFASSAEVPPLGHVEDHAAPDDRVPLRVADDLGLLVDDAHVAVRPHEAEVERAGFAPFVRGPAGTQDRLAVVGVDRLRQPLRRGGERLGLVTADAEGFVGPDDAPGEEVFLPTAEVGDALRGDRTLFGSQAGVEAQWRIVEPVLNDPRPPEIYEPGSWGPKEKGPPEGGPHED